jgi:hypothetical protein
MHNHLQTMHGACDGLEGLAALYKKHTLMRSRVVPTDMYVVTYSVTSRVVCSCIQYSMPLCLYGMCAIILYLI